MLSSQFKAISFGLLCLPSFVAFSSPMFEVKGVNEHVRIRTLAANHTYTQAGIKINTAGYSLSKAGTQCTPKASGYCTFTVSDKLRKTISLSGPTGTVAFTLCLDGVGKLSCQNYSASILRSTTTFSIGGSVTGLSQSGLILQNNGLDDTPIAAGSSSYVFPLPVPQGGSYEVSLVQQPLGEFCSLRNDSGTNVQSNVTDVNVSCRDIYTYVSDNTGVSLLLINSDGTLGSRSLTYSTSARPYGVVLNKARTRALVALNQSQTVANCLVNPDGTFGACGDSGVGQAFGGGPTGITLNKAQTLAYVVNGSGNGALTKCNYNSTTGMLSNCVAQPTPTGLISFALGITLNNANTYAYIASPHNANPSNGLIARCSIQANGSLVNCSSTVQIYDAQGIFFNTTGTLAYVASESGSKMYRCNVVNDELTDCTVQAPSFIQPFGGAVNNRNSIAYVVNGSQNGFISMCSINSAGSLSSCRESGAGVFNFPNYLISFN